MSPVLSTLQTITHESKPTVQKDRPSAVGTENFLKWDFRRWTAFRPEHFTDTMTRRKWIEALALLSSGFHSLQTRTAEIRIHDALSKGTDKSAEDLASEATAFGSQITKDMSDDEMDKREEIRNKNEFLLNDLNGFTGQMRDFHGKACRHPADKIGEAQSVEVLRRMWSLTHHMSLAESFLEDTITAIK